MEIIKADRSQLQKQQSKSGEISTRVYSSDEKKEILSALSSCMMVQRTYGKQASDINLMLRVFLDSLSSFEAEEISQACREWMKESPDFPTPFDLRNIMIAKRNEIMSRCRFRYDGRMTHDENGNEV